MASRTIDGGAKAPLITLPPILACIMGVPVAPRSAVEAVIERAIDALDEIDGPLVEANGDELDGSPAEDEFMDHGHGNGAGCVISDPDAAVDDSNCDEPYQDLEEERGVNVATVTNCIVYALEPDPMTGKRACLGMSNPGDNFHGTQPGSPPAPEGE